VEQGVGRAHDFGWLMVPSWGGGPQPTWQGGSGISRSAARGEISGRVFEREENKIMPK